jgi:large conductance mechanosensitive channel
MKKFLKEFKEFALKGNVMDLAIGVIIGGAFQAIVTALTDCFLNPLINSIGGAEIGGHIQIFNTGQYLEYGAFLTAVINFIIMAFVIFLLMKGINKLMSLGKKEEATAPLTKKCPYCMSEIDIKATKCAHCTSDVE